MTAKHLVWQVREKQFESLKEINKELELKIKQLETQLSEERTDYFVLQTDYDDVKTHIVGLMDKLARVHKEFALFKAAKQQEEALYHKRAKTFITEEEKIQLPTPCRKVISVQPISVEPTTTTVPVKSVPPKIISRSTVSSAPVLKRDRVIEHKPDPYFDKPKKTIASVLADPFFTNIESEALPTSSTQPAPVSTPSIVKLVEASPVEVTKIMEKPETEKIAEKQEEKSSTTEEKVEVEPKKKRVVPDDDVQDDPQFFSFDSYVFCKSKNSNTNNKKKDCRKL